MSDLAQRVRSVGVINVAAIFVAFAAGILAAVAAPQLGLPSDPWLVVGVVIAALIVLAIAAAFIRGTQGGRASVYGGVLLVTSVLLPGVVVAIAVPLYLFLLPDQ